MPLRTLITATRRRALDVVLVALFVLVQADLFVEVHSLPAALLGAWSVLILLVRGRSPYIAIVGSFLGQLVLLEIVPDEPGTVFLLFLLSFLVAGSLATERAAWIGWVAGLAVIPLSERGSRSLVAAINDFLLTAGFCTAIFVLALLVARRSRSHRAVLARAEADATEAVTRERSRIAREMHDVVAHSLTVAVVQCVAALDDLDRGPDQGPEGVRTRVSAAEQACRDALDELRRMLGVLRFTPDQLEPTPNLATLVELATSIERAGVKVDLELGGALDGLPPGVELTCYRIVQEALTNTLRHAGAQRATVSIDGGTENVTVRVLDDGRGPSTPAVIGPGGQGLIGMRERASAYGGTLVTGVGPAGGYLVEAVIPRAEHP